MPAPLGERLCHRRTVRGLRGFPHVVGVAVTRLPRPTLGVSLTLWVLVFLAGIVLLLCAWAGWELWGAFIRLQCCPKP